ncbi:MAG TPA: hypothetical protein VF613_05405 [Longimicrobium sp.]|jgi:hypothetical protein
MAALSHLRPLSFGEILDSAFSLYRRHFVPMILTTLIPAVPTGVLTVLMGYTVLRATGGNDPDAYAMAILPVSLLSMVIYLVMWAALAHLVGQAWTGGDVSVADGYRRGFRAFFPLLGSMILAYVVAAVVVMIVTFAMALVVAVIAALLGPSLAGQGTAATGAVGVLVAVVAIAFLLGVIAYASSLFAVLPAIVIERLGPAQAIGRSFRLGRGARLHVTGVVIVTFIIVFLPVVGIGLLTGTFASFSDPSAVPSPGQFVVQQVAAMVTGSLTTPFMVAAMVLLYFDRRVRLEAFDLHMAADGLATA